MKHEAPPAAHPRRRPALRPRLLAACAAVAGALLLTPPLLLANGGALRLANVPMGEYRVSVFTDPTPVRPDTLDVSVLVLREGVEGVAEDVEVTVRTRLLEHRGEPGEGAAVEVGASESRPATREQADDPRYYAAKFALGAEGRWEVTVAVHGEGGAGEASFEVTARPRGPLGHPVVIVLLALLPLAVAAGWILREGDEESAREPQEPAREPPPRREPDDTAKHRPAPGADLPRR